MGLIGRKSKKSDNPVQHFTAKINGARQYRKDEGIDDLWRRMVDMYRGRQFPVLPTAGEDRIVINIAKATIDAIVPAVSLNVPKVTLTARHYSEEDAASIAEAVVNYQFKVYRYKEPLNRCLKDSLILGIGIAKTGWRFVEEDAAREVADMEAEYSDLMDQVDQYGAENPDMAHNLPSDEHVMSQISATTRKVVADHPIVERVSPFDIFVDPTATNFGEIQWIAQRMWMTLDEVREDPRYNADARKLVEPSAAGRYDETKDSSYRNWTSNGLNRNKSMVCVWEYWDLHEGFMCTFTDGAKSFLIDPVPQPYAYGSPFEFIIDTEIPEILYPMGQLEAIEDLQHELNKTRSQLMNHRKKHGRKYVYDPQAFSAASIAQLQADRDNVMVPVEDGFDPDKAIRPVQQVPVPSDLYQARQQIIEDVQLVSGANDFQLNTEATRRKTATEASIVNDVARGRAEYKIGQYESFCTRVASKVLQLDQQFLAGEQVAHIVGADGAVYWFNYTPEDIAGEFHFDVEAGSTAPVNEGTKRREAMDLSMAMTPFVQMGVVDPLPLAEQLLKGFGIKNPARFLKAPPPPMPGMPPGGPGGPPGGPGGPPQPGPQATPMQAAQQGVSPELAQQNQLSGQVGLNIGSPDGP